MNDYKILAANYVEVEIGWDEEHIATVKFSDADGNEKWLTAAGCMEFVDCYLSDDDITDLFESTAEEDSNKIADCHIDEFNGIKLYNKEGELADLYYYKENEACGLVKYLFTLLDEGDNAELIHNAIGKNSKEINIMLASLMMC